MADVTTNVSGSTERNGSVVVGAPKGAKTNALGSKYISTPGDVSDMTIKGAVGGVNDAPEVAQLETKWTTRFDDIRYYTNDA
ncbi:hypothetical protein CL634_06335 [bacterium]|nr:hypothetical protein [bacterium]|tara:strand:+ start:1938 stop:2183 length:246 start_codon:yes stop_codon:yes gene_type:complete